MKLVAKEDKLFLTHGKSYETIMIRLVRFEEGIDADFNKETGYIECNIIDDIGTECWHKLSSFYTLEEWRELQLNKICQ